jgi:hypothetical protein
MSVYLHIFKSLVLTAASEYGEISPLLEQGDEFPCPAFAGTAEKDVLK